MATINNRKPSLENQAVANALSRGRNTTRGRPDIKNGGGGGGNYSWWTFFFGG